MYRAAEVCYNGLMLCSPPFCAAGSAVRIIAPSGAFERGRFAAGCAWLDAAGWKLRYEPQIFRRARYLAGDDRRRIAELQAALAEPDTSVIWAARGGYGATRLLPALDPAAVRRAGKWLVGFSDITALHAVWQRAGLISLHGANVTTLGDWSGPARDALVSALRGTVAPRLAGTVWHGGASVEGPLVGGNLAVLAAMAGTGFLPDAHGAVVLLEDVGERPYRLDRTLTQLRQAGFFAGALGVVVGQLSSCDGPADADYDAATVVRDELAALGVPVVGNIDVGHAPSSYPVVLGAPTRLDPAEGTVEQRFPASSA